MIDSIDEEVSAFFETWRSVEYIPASDEAAERFKAATQRRQGEIILWDLVNALEDVGHHIERPIMARSKYEPDMLREPLRRYERGGKMGAYDKQAFKKAYNKVRRMFLTKGEKLSPLRLEECEFEGDKNSGAPHFLRKRDVHQLALNEAYAIRRGKAPPPATIFHRGKNLEECRPVFGYPFSLTLMETRFFQPYQDALLNSPHTPYVGGKLDCQIAGMLNEIRLKSRWVVELDYRGLDGSASAYLISKAFEIIRENFDLDEFDAHDWDIIVRYHIFAPVLAPDGRMYYGKDHGVLSGSMFTQLLDTIISMFGVFYTKEVENLDLTRVLGLGDDAELGQNGEPPNLEVYANRMAELGLTINTVKSRVKTANEPLHFLGHEWSRMYAIRSLEESLTRLVTPERNNPDFWAKKDDPETYYAALEERILRYQEDNPLAWDTLQRVLQRVRYPQLDTRQLLIAASISNLYFAKYSQQVERARWKRTPVSAQSTNGKQAAGAHRLLASWY